MKEEFSFFIIRLMAVIFLGLTFANSCKKDEPAPPVKTNNIVEVTADINNPTLWDKDSIYLIRKWDFYVNSTLTIEAGTVVKFHPTDGPFMTLGGAGTINASGTGTDRIVFTSYKDDAHGGDTNMDGNTSLPGVADWGHINTNGLQGSVFNYCDFLYGGGNADLNTLELYDSRATVTNCTFAHNKGGKDGDFYTGALDASEALLNTLITGNTFYDNIIPLSISDKVDIDDSNTFGHPSTSPGNTYNGIFYNTTNHIESSRTWQETEVAFVIDDVDLWIESGASLTLGNNVVVKFTEGSELVLADGATSLVNHNGSGVIFTSFKDDTKKGDTNGDGAATSPGNFDWIGIYDNTADKPPYFFPWTNILYDSH